jgi:hypothetical protein
LKCYFQDFYLDLKEDNTTITPCNYLELALRPVLGSGKDVAARNKVFAWLDLTVV